MVNKIIKSYCCRKQLDEKLRMMAQVLNISQSRIIEESVGKYFNEVFPKKLEEQKMFKL